MMRQTQSRKNISTRISVSELFSINLVPVYIRASVTYNERKIDKGLELVSIPLGNIKKLLNHLYTSAIVRLSTI